VSAAGGSVPQVDASTATAARGRRHRSGFWGATFAFLVVMAVATLPSPLYGLYRTRDHLSALTVTVVFAIFAASTIAVLLRDSSIAARIGRRGTMLASVATMMVAMGVLAAWKDLSGLLIGRVITGVSVGLAAGTAITYLIELRLHADPKASAVRAQIIGTSVTVGALGIGPLIAGCLAQWVTQPLTVPYLALFLVAGALIGAGSGAVFKGTTGIVLEAAAPEDRLRMTSQLLIALFIGLSIPVIGAGIALDQGASAPNTVLGFAVLVGLGVAAAGWELLGRRGAKTAKQLA